MSNAVTDSKAAQIARCLALAEGSSGPEAEAAFAMAQKLASLYAVDLEVARRQMADRTKREAPVTKRISFEAELATRNTKKALVELISSLCYVNDCKINVFHDSTGVIIFGFPTDIDLIERMFAVIAVQMIVGADQFIKSKSYREEFVTYYDSYGFPERKRMDGRTARINYYDSFNNTIYRRLKQMKREAEESREEEAVPITLSDGAKVESSVALVLMEKRDEVKRFYKETSNARGSWSGSRAGGHSSTASSAGKRDGANARLGRDAQIGGGGRAIR
jgi:hypothetical protein